MRAVLDRTGLVPRSFSVPDVRRPGTRFRAVVLGIGAALIVLSLTCAASAQPSGKHKAAAEALFQEGKALFDQGRYDQACAKFAASQELDAGFGTLMNLGECYERRGMTASAWATFKEAAALASSTQRTERETAARERSAHLEGRLAKLLVQLPEAALALEGLTVRLNGTALPRGVWGSAVPVDPGTQHVEVAAPGYETWQTELEVSNGPGQTPVVVPPLARSASEPNGATLATPPPTPVASRDPLSSRGDGTQRTVGFVLAGAGAVGLAVGTVFGLSAISKNGDSDEHCRTERFCSEKGLALRDDARDAAAVSTIAFIAGGAFAAGGLALVLTASNTSTPAAGSARRPSARRFTLASRLEPGAARLVMEGTW